MFWAPAESSSTAFDFTSSAFCWCQNTRAGHTTYHWTTPLSSEQRGTVRERLFDFSPHLKRTNTNTFLHSIYTACLLPVVHAAEVNKQEGQSRCRKTQTAEEKISDTAMWLCETRLPTLLWNAPEAWTRISFSSLLFFAESEEALHEVLVVIKTYSAPYSCNM